MRTELIALLTAAAVALPAAADDDQSADLDIEQRRDLNVGPVEGANDAALSQIAEPNTGERLDWPPSVEVEAAGKAALDQLASAEPGGAVDQLGEGGPDVSVEQNPEDAVDRCDPPAAADQALCRDLAQRRARAEAARRERIIAADRARTDALLQGSSLFGAALAGETPLADPNDAERRLQSGDVFGSQVAQSVGSDLLTGLGDAPAPPDGLEGLSREAAIDVIIETLGLDGAGGPPPE